MANYTTYKRSPGVKASFNGFNPDNIISKTAPLATDIARPGTLWVDTVANQVYVFTSSAGGVANWAAASSGVIPLPVASGGTNATSFATVDGVVYFDGTRLVTTSAGTSGQVLTSNGAGVAPTYQTVSGTGTVTSVTGGTGITVTGTPTINPTVSLTIPVVISSGGTNATSMANTFGVNYFDGTRLVTTTVGTSGQILTSNGAGVAPTFQAAPGGSISITGNSGGALTGSSFTFTGASTGLLFSGLGTTQTLTGTLGVANGGTGIATATAYAPIIAGTTATGAFQVASTGQGTAGFVLTSTGSSSLPTWQAAAGGGITAISGNSGTATGSTINLVTTLANAGKTPQFAASGNSVTLNLSDTNGNLFIGPNAGTLTPGSGGFNIALGSMSLNNLSNSSQNIIIGDFNGSAITTGGSNIGMGSSMFGNLSTGTGNCGFGTFAGLQWNTGTESDNIIFNSQGVTGDNNTLRLGQATGTSSRELKAAYICGIDGVNVGSVSKVVTMASDQLGTATLTAGSGITITPTANTITIAASGGGTGKSVWATTNSIISIQSSSSFLNPFGGAGNNTEASIVMIVPTAGTISNLYINVSSSGASSSMPFTLRVNGSNSALVATVSAASTGVFSDTTHSVSVVAGDLVSVRATVSGGDSLDMGMSMQFSA